MIKMWKWIVSLVDTSKLAGWVRSGVGAIITIVSLKYFGGKISPDMNVAISTFIATAVVGVWQQIAKKMDPDYKPE
jgi:hypothetical protein